MLEKLSPAAKWRRQFAKAKGWPLLWSDVDEKNMAISISKQAYRTKGALTVQPPKTDNSMRKIALSPETMEQLKQEHDKHPGSPYMFSVAVPGVSFARRSGLESRRPLPLAPPSPVTGGMYHPNSVVKFHQKILKDAGFTLATYTHATNKVQEQAAAKMGSLLKQAL